MSFSRLAPLPFLCGPEFRIRHCLKASVATAETNGVPTDVPMSGEGLHGVETRRREPSHGRRRPRALERRLHMHLLFLFPFQMAIFDYSEISISWWFAFSIVCVSKGHILQSASVRGSHPYRRLMILPDLPPPIVRLPIPQPPDMQASPPDSPAPFLFLVAWLRLSPIPHPRAPLPLPLSWDLPGTLPLRIRPRKGARDADGSQVIDPIRRMMRVTRAG